MNNLNTIIAINAGFTLAGLAAIIVVIYATLHLKKK
jgi:hypothetical protein